MFKLNGKKSFAVKIELCPKVPTKAFKVSYVISGKNTHENSTYGYGKLIINWKLKLK